MSDADTRREYVARAAILAGHAHIAGETTPEAFEAELARLQAVLDPEPAAAPPPPGT